MKLTTANSLSCADTKNNTVVIIVVVVVVVVVLIVILALVVLAVLIYCYYKRKPKKETEPTRSQGIMGGGLKLVAWELELELYFIALG